MKKYIYIDPDKNTVGSILDEVDPVFPRVPIEKRFSHDFLSACLVMDENEFNEKGIYSGMVYDKETGEFTPLPTPKDPVLPSPEENPDQPIDPGASEEHQTYSEKLDSLTAENTLLKAQIQAQTDRSDFIEDCIAEMAMLVYAE